MLGRELAAAGLVVVSGLARGIDGEAHRGALEAGGLTVAVLGCGIDRDYPAAHAELARRIARARPGRLGVRAGRRACAVALPRPQQDHRRRFSAATVVVEARERSGALITADLALEEGRDVLAVPGEITSALSAGTNALLRLGATPVHVVPTTCSSSSASVIRRAPPAVEGAAKQVLAALPGAADDVARTTGLDAGASPSHSRSSSSPASRARATGSSGRRVEDRVRQRHALEERLLVRRIGQRLGLAEHDVPRAGEDAAASGEPAAARVRACAKRTSSLRVAVTKPPPSSSFATGCVLAATASSMRFSARATRPSSDARAIGLRRHAERIEHRERLAHSSNASGDPSAMTVPPIRFDERDHAAVLRLGRLLTAGRRMLARVARPLPFEIGCPSSAWR